MELDSIRTCLDLERRMLATHGGPIEILPHVTRIRGSEGAWHAIVYSALADDTADATIDEQVEHYRWLNVEFEWKVYGHDQPADLRARLARRGFEVGPLEAVLVLDLETRPGWIDETNTSDVVRVTTVEQLVQFGAAAEAIFERDASATLAELAAGRRSGTSEQVGYMAMVNGEPVSIGRLYMHAGSQFGGLYGGGTRPESRGQGHYRATVAARSRDALQQGVRYMLVDALPTSRPILERLGFVHLTDTWPCVWQSD